MARTSTLQGYPLGGPVTNSNSLVTKDTRNTPGLAKAMLCALNPRAALPRGAAPADQRPQQEGRGEGSSEVRHSAAEAELLSVN